MSVLKFSSEEEWLALREAHVGGSDIASLFNTWISPEGEALILHAYEAPPVGSTFDRCLSTYKSSYRLWQEKAGRLKPDFKETERVTAGKFMEPALAAWAMEKWPEMKMRKVRRYLRHDQHPGWGASLDYELVSGDMEPVEFKNVDWMIFKEKWGKDGDDYIPPIHINLQLQTQIGVKPNAKGGWIIVCVGGNELHRVYVERHEASQERIGAAIDMFWAGIEAGADPEWLAEFDTVAEMAKRGSKDAATVQLTDYATMEARRFMRWKRHADYVNARIDTMKARVGLELLDSTNAVGTDGLTVSWPMSGRIAKMIPAKWQDAATWRAGFIVKPYSEPKPAKAKKVKEDA